MVTLRTKKQIGWVAEFCTLCQGVRPFRLRCFETEQDQVPKSITSECSICGGEWATEVSRYASVRTRQGEMIDLVSETNPGLVSVNHERIKRAIRRRDETLSTGDRSAMIDEILDAAGAWGTHFSPSDWKDPRTILGALGLVIAVAVMIGLFFLRGWWGCLLGGAFLVVALTFHGLAQAVAHPRLARQKITPALARALRTLSPTQEELESRIDFHPILKVVDPRSIIELIELTVPGVQEQEPGLDLDLEAIEPIQESPDESALREASRGERMREVLVAELQSSGKNYRYIQFDRWFLIGSSMSVCSIIACVGLLDSEPEVLFVLFAVTVLGLVLAVAALATSPRRRLRGIIYPGLARDLLEIDPSVEEILQALNYLGSMGIRSAGNLKAKAIRQAIEDLHDTTSTD